MKNLKYFFGSIALFLLLGLSTTAVVQASSNCDPGQILTPCGSSATVHAPTPGETSTPPAGALGQTDTPPVDEVSLTEIASSVLLSMVSLF
jgi:hypothetical protein